MAKFELLLLKDRQKRGIAAARLRGKHLGRPRKILEVGTSVYEGYLMKGA
jgi:DNA invertase Pin-like site-specific DNA recombinase